MAAPKVLQDRIKPGGVFEVTNHYIKREDHPCYGTRLETIQSVNSASFYFTTGGLKWPTRDRFTVNDDGSVTLYGYGASQEPHELFMTLKPVN